MTQLASILDSSDDDKPIPRKRDASPDTKDADDSEEEEGECPVFLLNACGFLGGLLLKFSIVYVHVFSDSQPRKKVLKRKTAASDDDNVSDDHRRNSDGSDDDNQRGYYFYVLYMLC